MPSVRMTVLVLALSLLALAACNPAGPSVEPNPFGGETKDVTHQPGSEDHAQGVIRTITYYDEAGTRRRQIDYFSEKNILFKSGGVGRADATFNPSGGLIEIKTYTPEGEFIESIIPQPAG